MVFSFDNFNSTELEVTLKSFYFYVYFFGHITVYFNITDQLPKPISFHCEVKLHVRAPPRICPSSTNHRLGKQLKLGKPQVVLWFVQMLPVILSRHYSPLITEQKQTGIPMSAFPVGSADRWASPVSVPAWWRWNVMGVESTQQQWRRVSRFMITATKQNKSRIQKMCRYG